MPTTQTFARLFTQSSKYILLVGAVLSIVTGLYLLFEYQVINRNAINLLWRINNELPATDSQSPILYYSIQFISSITNLSAITVAHFIMLSAHAGIIVFSLKIVKTLNFSITSQWAVIFLLISHPAYNDFRTYIIAEPIYWLCWLAAIYAILTYHRTHLIYVIFVWLGLFFIASYISILAWLWIFVFPFGLLFWSSWRKKSVIYALIAYVIIATILFYIPFHDERSGFQIFFDIFHDINQFFKQTLANFASDWLDADDPWFAGVYLFSGGLSLILLRLVMSFGIVCGLLLLYCYNTRLYTVMSRSQRQFLLYVVIFDILSLSFISILEFNFVSSIYFSTAFILLLFAALGLATIFRKIYFAKYPKHYVLIFVWFMVAYFASSYLSFGPNKAYLKSAGLDYENSSKVYSNNGLFLFYADKNPNELTNPEFINFIGEKTPFYYAFDQGRDEQSVPTNLVETAIVAEYMNEHQDKIIIYYITPKN